MTLRPDKEIDARLIDDGRIVISVESCDAEEFVLTKVKECGTLFHVEGDWKEFMLIPRSTFDTRSLLRYIRTQGSSEKDDPLDALLQMIGNSEESDTKNWNVD